MRLLSPPGWLTKYQSPISLLRPKMRKGLIGLWLPSVGHMGNLMWDTSGYSNNLAYVGDTETVISEAGPVWAFDGSDYSRKAIAQWHPDDHAGTILHWIRTATTGSRIFGSSDEAHTDRYLNTFINAGKLGVHQRNADPSTIANGTSTITDNVWHMTSVSSTGSAYRFNVDGEFEATQGTNNGDWFADVSTRDNIIVGGLIRSSGFDNGFVGQIGPVAVWSYPLSGPVLYSLANDFWNAMFRRPSRFNRKVSGPTTTIRLDWTDNSEHEDGFSIERKTDAGAFAEIDTVAAGVETYNNVNVPEGHTYTYRVKATSTPLGDSEYSNEAAETV